MQRLLIFIDTLSAWVGKAFAWCILVLTFGESYEIFVRKFPYTEATAWAYDVSYIMYGTLFMMAGAYALSRDAHVRGDVIYRLWPPRVQAAIQFVLYIVFFFPGMAALIYAGIEYANDSWGYMPYGPAGQHGEISINSPIGVPISPLKTVLPAAAIFLSLQGLAEMVRCVICMRTGKWPDRLADVEELEKTLIAQREHELEHELHLDNNSGSAQK